MQSTVKGSIIAVISLAFALFGIWSNSIGMIATMEKAGAFVGFTLALVFLLNPSKNKKLIYVDYLLALLGAVVGAYTFLTANRLAIENLNATGLDYIMAGIAILLILEASRRCLGLWMLVLPTLFSCYALLGDRIPGPLGHYGFTLKRFLLRMYLVDEGVYGITTQVASSYIFLFILFGAVLAESGTAQFFIDLSNKLAGQAVGGPAKVATISSALMGTISGSAAANVATTGTFTIPMMKKIGFKPEFAGAVEAVASTGGMIMPPIMGAAAFLMAQYLCVSYSDIIIAAIIPALLYYLSVYSWVHFEASRLHLATCDKDQLPPIEDIERKMMLFLPLVSIVVALFRGRTPIFAAFLGMVVCIIVGVFQKPGLTIRRLVQALQEGAQSSLGASMACISAGIIVGVASMTGVGQVITYNITMLSGNNLFIALCLTAVASLILSMGLPATACYIIVATVVAPALVKMGALPIAAHFFVFYFSCLSNITPPVAIASYTAAGIAKASPFAVGWNSMKIAAPGFIVPFLFVYNPILLAQNMTTGSLLVAIATSITGVIFLAAGGAGYLFQKTSLSVRLCYVIGSCLLIIPEWRTDLIGILIIVFGVLKDRTDGRRAIVKSSTE
ncbi:MAG: TRAP transporter permease [bacterium]|jgi:TRAP transporter 4TM/12TM fusion protein